MASYNIPQKSKNANFFIQNHDNTLFVTFSGISIAGKQLVFFPDNAADMFRNSLSSRQHPNGYPRHQTGFMNVFTGKFWTFICKKRSGIVCYMITYAHTRA